MDHVHPSLPPTDVDDGGDHEGVLQRLFVDVERSGTLPEHVHAFEAIDTVLCALEMRLPRAQAIELLHDVPPTLRTLIRRCAMHHADRPEIDFDELAFLRLVASGLHTSVEDAERITRAVFVAVQRFLPEEEIIDVRDRLPGELSALWYPPSMSGVEPFEEPPPEPREITHGARPLEEPTERILREIESSGVLPSGVSPIEALQAVLCSFSFELTRHEAEEVSELSPTFHDLLVPCIRHRGERPVVSRRPTFEHELADHLGIEDRHAEQVARTVFAAIRARLPADDVKKIDNRLPYGVRILWHPR